LGYLLTRCVARCCDAVIAHPQAARRALEASYGPLPNCTVIAHGSYIGLYGPQLDRAESRAALGLPIPGPVLLNLGTLRPYKGIEDLLAAFAQLPADTRGTLLIAGAAKDHAYAAALERQAATIPGARLHPRFILDEQLPVYLAAADVVVLPYHALLTSGVLLWALSYGRPVVAPAFGAVRELVREGQEGFLFTPGDMRGLHDALARALAHPDLDAMGRSALAVARDFAWPNIAELTAVCYRTTFEGLKSR
jgi:glycosyltransferase involved in cell wall biosynthesis